MVERACCEQHNWLASDQSVTALLDFEWARLGEPADDWFFLARFSGPHMETVLDAIVRATTTSAETLRHSARFARQPTSPPTFALRLNTPAPVPGWLLSVSADSRNSPPGTTGGATPGDASSGRRHVPAK
jgi:hypothetical protein